jgi:hypothetical protein
MAISPAAASPVHAPGSSAARELCVSQSPRSSTARTACSPAGSRVPRAGRKLPVYHACSIAGRSLAPGRSSAPLILCVAPLSSAGAHLFARSSHDSASSRLALSISLHLLARISFMATESSFSAARGPDLCLLLARPRGTSSMAVVRRRILTRASLLGVPCFPLPLGALPTPARVQPSPTPP